MLLKNNIIYQDNGIDEHASCNSVYYGMRDRIAQTECYNCFSRRKTLKDLSVLQDTILHWSVIA